MNGAALGPLLSALAWLLAAGLALAQTPPPPGPGRPDQPNHSNTIFPSNTKTRVDLEVTDEPARPSGGAVDGGTASVAAPSGPSVSPLASPGSLGEAAPATGASGDARLSLPATAESARTQLARERHAEAVRQVRRKDYPRALAGFQDAYALDPRNAGIVNDLAYLHQLLGNPLEAERYYRETLLLSPERAIAYANLADLLHQKGASPERLAEAAGHLQRARELMGNKPTIILRQARLHAARGLAEEAARYYRELVSLQKPSDAVRLEIGDFYRDFGRDDEALSWYRQIAERERLGPEAAQRIWQLGVEREARRYGWTRPSEAVPEQARTLAEKARMLHKQEKYDEAERLLRRALRLAPQFSAASAELGNVLRDAGRREDAEVAYLRALAFEQGNAELYARLGRLYLGASRPGRAAEAALFLQRALQLRPDWTELHLRLGRAYRSTGDLPRALGHVERFLALGQNAEELREARALRAELTPLVQHKAGRDGATDGAEVGAGLVRALNRARALFARGEPDAAMAELRRLPEKERGVEVQNLAGRILLAAGRLEDAAQTLTASLRHDEKQGDIHEQLGLLRARLGDVAAARSHLERAEALGNAAARYHLTRLEAEEEGRSAWSRLVDVFRIPRLLSLRERIAAFLDAAASSVHVDEARALLDDVESRILVAAIGAGATLLLLLGLGLWLRRRLYGGLSLQALLAEHPEAGPDVQRILSAIRHEVLKHNTLVLTGLAEAIARGERAAEKAAFCYRSLFGTGSESGAMARLHAYAEELQQVGRAHGVRLNLHRRDPALSALLRGFTVMRKVGGVLNRVDGLGPRARARLLRQLQLAARLLNTEGYEAVRSLLDRLRVLDVDAELLTSIFARTLREPALAAAMGRVQPLVLSAPVLPVHVLMPRRAFEDILQNLLRNAIESSLREGAEGALVVGLAVELELDPITGLQRVVFLVRDRSPATVTAEVLRGRTIEEGLGLTAELVSRYEGTLDVLPGEDGWAKSVVVKLPRAETAMAEEEAV